MESLNLKLIKLASNLDSMGFYEESDHLFKIAQEKVPFDWNVYLSSLQNKYKNMKNIQDIDNLGFRRQYSFWLMENGELIKLGTQGHYSAEESTLQNLNMDRPQFSSEELRGNEETYFTMHHFGKALRLNLHKGVLLIESLGMPTEEQFNTLEQIVKSPMVSKVLIQQSDEATGTWTSENLFTWKDKLQKSLPVKEEPFMTNEPYYKAMERRRLLEEYPGEKNKKIRELYEKSASRFSHIVPPTKKHKQ